MVKESATSLTTFVGLDNFDACDTIFYMKNSKRATPTTESVLSRLEKEIKKLRKDLKKANEDIDALNDRVDYLENPSYYD